MSNKKHIVEPNLYLTIDSSDYRYVNLLLRDLKDTVFELYYIEKSQKENYNIRRGIISKVLELLETYPIDTIIMEKNKLSIDKIDHYPDPYVLKNILLGYGISISIDDAFHNTIENILEVPSYEWHTKILGYNSRYAIDMYKAHIMCQSKYDDYIEEINNKNYYKVICLSECAIFDVLMQEKYRINGESGRN